MSYVREAGVNNITNFAVPFQGTQKGVAANLLNPATLYDSLNVYLRKGKLRNRPGFTLFNPTVFDHPIIGGGLVVTPEDKLFVAVSRGTFYSYSLSSHNWSTISQQQFADNDNSLIDLAYMQTGTQFAVVVASNGFQLKYWLGSGDVLPITTAPNATSVCTAGRRVVALIAPHTLQWTQVLTYDQWPALAYDKVAQTNDKGICVMSLGTLDFVLYKERSIYVGKSQSGTDATAFNINFRQTVEGPAGLHAVVDVGGKHYYMTKNGRVGTFDGSSFVQWVCDGLWFFLQDDIDPRYAYKIFGVYDYRLYTVTFHYPRNDDNGKMYGMVVINLPLQGSGVGEAGTYVDSNGNGVTAPTIAPFLGLSTEAMSFGYDIRFEDIIDRSLYFGMTGKQSFILDETATTDNGQLYNCAFQTALFALPDMQHYHLSIESFLQRQRFYGHVNVMPVVSESLETEHGTVLDDKFQIIDLNNIPSQEYMGFDAQTRFFGLRYEWTSDSTVRWAGTSLYGRATTSSQK